MSQEEVVWWEDGRDSAARAHARSYPPFSRPFPLFFPQPHATYTVGMGLRSLIGGQKSYQRSFFYLSLVDLLVAHIPFMTGCSTCSAGQCWGMRLGCWYRSTHAIILIPNHTRQRIVIRNGCYH